MTTTILVIVVDPRPAPWPGWGYDPSNAGVGPETPAPRPAEVFAGPSHWHCPDCGCDNPVDGNPCVGCGGFGTVKATNR